MNLTFDISAHCEAGFGGTDTCNKCTEGTYKETAGFGPCKPCSEDFPDFTSNENKTSCDVCKCLLLLLVQPIEGILRSCRQGSQQTKYCTTLVFHYCYH